MLLYFLFPAREGYLRGQRDANIRVGAHDRKDLLGEVDSGAQNRSQSGRKHGYTKDEYYYFIKTGLGIVPRCVSGTRHLRFGYGKAGIAEVGSFIYCREIYPNLFQKKLKHLANLT